MSRWTFQSCTCTNNDMMFCLWPSNPHDVASSDFKLRGKCVDEESSYHCNCPKEMQTQKFKKIYARKGLQTIHTAAQHALCSQLSRICGQTFSTKPTPSWPSLNPVNRKTKGTSIHPNMVCSPRCIAAIALSNFLAWQCSDTVIPSSSFSTS